MEEGGGQGIEWGGEGWRGEGIGRFGRMGVLLVSRWEVWEYGYRNGACAD